MSEDRLIDVNKVLSKKAKGKKVPGFLVSLIKRFIHQDFLNSIIAKSGDGVDFCTDTIREFSVYRWDNDIKRDAPKKENDHAMDDIRYFVQTVIDGDRDDCSFSIAVERK